jgi:DNA replication protein DnaC
MRMAHLKTAPSRTLNADDVERYLRDLKLAFIAEHYGDLAQQAAHKQWAHLDYLGRLVEGEALLRQDRATQRRIHLARFPMLKTLDQFRWDWPAQINQALIQHHFTLSFLKDHMNLIYLGSVGLGKTHLAIALGYEACLKGHSVFFTSAIDVINTLASAKSTGRLKQEIKKYTKPSLLIVDELGYLPIDKSGADLLFQVISGRYEQGSTLITSNRAFKDWPKIFNNDSTLTAALLDRLLHHAETVVIEGKSYRMKGKLEA